MSKLKLAPFVALVAFVALYQPTLQPPEPASAPVRLRPLSWQPSQAPAVTFNTPGPDADTSGAFGLALLFDNAGGAHIAPNSLQLRASRSITVGGAVIAAGENLAAVSGVMTALDASGASAWITQTGAGALFENGEYILYARISNQDGRHSPWATRRIFIEGATPAVVKASTPLKHGDSQVTVVLSGQNLDTVTEADFGAGITVHSLAAAASSVTCTVSVADDAQAGPRSVVLGGGISTFVASPQAGGIVNITYPTDRMPSGGATEARRNAALAGEGVVLKNGAMTRTETDLAIEGIGLNLEFARTYRSDVEFNGPLGRNWQSWLFQRVAFDGSLKWYTAASRLEVFSAVAGGFIAPAGLYYKAERTSGGEVTLTERNGTRLMFNAEGKLAFIVDRNNNVVECEYNHLGQVYRIIDSRGERVRLLYGDDGRVASLRDRAWSDTSPRTVKYHYNTQGELVRCQAPETAQYNGASRLTRKFDYDAQHRLIRIFNPREHAHNGLPWLENEWGGGRVLAQRIGGSGAWTHFRYPANRQRRVVDPRGLRTDYQLNAKGMTLTASRFTAFWGVDMSSTPDHTLIVQLAPKLRATDPETFIDDFAYGINEEVTRHTLPRGNRIRFAYADPAELGSGTTTALSAFEISDSTKSWNNNQFAGRWLRLGVDVSDYRYYVIVSNSADTLALGTFEDLVADGFTATTPYAIFTANPDPLASGNCLSVTRQDGPVGAMADIVTSTSYEPRFQFPKTHTDARGYTTVFTWGYEVNGAGDPNECNLVGMQLPAVTAGQPVTQQAAWTFTRDNRGRIMAAVDPSGTSTLYEYFATGESQEFLQRVVCDPAGLAITHEFERNGVGQLTGYWPPRAHEPGADKDSHKMVFAVNEHGQITQASGPVLFENSSARAETYFIFDENGNVASRLHEYVTASGAQPQAPTDVYNPATFPRASSPMEATWIEEAFTYNNHNLPLTHTLDVASGATLTRATWSVAYDSGFNATKVTSPEGRVRERAIDERNLPFSLTVAPTTSVAGHWQFDYDANGNISRMLDARGFGWFCEYDGFERETRRVDPLGNSVRFTFDAADNLTLQEFLDSAQTVLARQSYDYDERGRAWRSQRMAKDRNGSNIGDGVDTTTLLLDALGRVTRSTNDLGQATNYTWDNASRLAKRIDAALNETEWGYDDAGGVIYRTQRDFDASNATFTISSAYADLDRLGNVRHVRDRRHSLELNTESDFTYDGLSQLITARQAGHAQASEYRYDLRGLLTGTTHKPDADAAHDVVCSQGFDLDGLPVWRAVLENPGEAEPQWQVTALGRDARGRVNAVSAPGMVWGFSHDACDNLLTRTDPAGTLATFTHDARGLCTLATITRGPGVMGSTQESWGYDALGRVSLAASAEGSQTLSVQTFSYNTLSLCELSNESLIRRDGLALGSFTTTRTYDTIGNCLTMAFSNGRTIAFAHDALSRVASATEGSDVLAAWRYVGARVKDISFGNGTVSSFGYDADLPEQTLLKRGSETLFAAESRYDAAGRPLAQRFAHEGLNGYVYRFDDMPRNNSDFSAPKGVKTWLPLDDFSAPKGVKTWLPLDDFSAPKGVKTWLPLDNFSAPKGVKTWLPLDDFSAPKGVKTWLPLDDFSAPKGVKTWLPLDDFSAPKGVKTWLPLDDFSAPKGVKTWLPLDDFSAPKGVKTWLPLDDFSAPKGVKTWLPLDDFSAPKGVKTWLPLDDFSAPKGVKAWLPLDDFSAPKGVKTWLPLDDFSAPSGPRLVSSFSGVDLVDDAALDDIPANYELARDISLDTRSSRVMTRDRSATADIYTSSYTRGTFNQYTSVDGAAVSYNAGRISHDAATGLHYAYDWRGIVVAEDIEGDFAAPERWFTMDALGRRVLEEYFYTSGTTVRYATRALVHDAHECNSELSLDGPTLLGLTQYLSGPGPAAWTQLGPPLSLAGTEHAPLRRFIVHELATQGAQSQRRFRCEDAFGRLMGVCDEFGRRLMECGSTESGAILIRRVLFDGGSRVQSVNADTPVPGQTTITLTGNWLTPATLHGRELCVALTTGTDRLRCATINSNDAASLVVDDPLGRIAQSAAVGFVVFDFCDAAASGGRGTGGHWSDAPVYAAGLTLFNDFGQQLGDGAGWLVSVNAEQGGVLPVNGTSGGSLTIKGDALTIGGEGRRYRLYAPAGVSAQTGGLELDLVARGTRCFGSTQLHDPFLAGYFDGAALRGAQSGPARTGHTLIGARRYDPSWGRIREPGSGWLNRYER